MMVRDHAETSIAVVPLGQAGFRLGCGDQVLYIDPYLSDQVEKVEGPHCRRLVPIWRSPDTVADADWVLVTHIHRDHCDLETLLPLSRASPQCRFISPGEVCAHLLDHGVAADRVLIIPETWLELAPGLRLHATPAAHPRIETDAAGRWKYVGYVIEFAGRRIYHSGDTALAPLLFEHLNRLKPIDVAMLPVNEQNFYREQLSIIGNMSLRDAFDFARDLGVSTLVPMHWDMFEPNRVYREEIELYYRLTQPSFQMRINPDRL